MTRRLLCLAVASMALPVCTIAQEYALQDYMPQKVGSKWTMQSSGGRGDETLTVEVDRTVDMDGTEVPLTLTKAADGTLRMGNAELVGADKLTLYGIMFGGRDGGQPTTVRYNPPAEFPGRIAPEQPEQATFKVKFGDRETDVTMKLELAAVEDVTVPKGTFEDCLKLVYTTTFGERETKRTVWYAKGVGAVKTEQPGFGDRPATITQLVDYELPE